jgi:hypothetical protein
VARGSNIKRVPKTGIYSVEKGMTIVPVKRVSGVKKVRRVGRVRKVGRSGGR